MPKFTFTGWDGAARAAETLTPNLIPAAGLTIPAGRRAVIRRMDIFSNRAAVVTTFWLTQNAAIVTAANHIAALSCPPLDGYSVNTYVYIDATAAAVPIIMSSIGNGAGCATFSCSGYFE